MSNYQQTNIGPGVIALQGDGTINVYQGKPTYRIEEFPAEPRRIRPRGLAAQPSRLLLSRHQVVPFTGRQAEIESLIEWRDDSEEPGLAVRLLYGPGGQGKTRLAAHFAELSRRSGWTVWQADQDPGDPLRVETPGPAAAAGTLVVVDYAERWSVGALHELFQDPVLFRRGGPVRMLLLSRPADEWWTSLAAWLDRRLDVAADAYPLSPLADDPALRAELFEHARDRFAALLGLPEDCARAVAPPPALAQGKEYAQVLTIHTAALVAVDARLHGDEAPTDPIRASAHLLKREIEHWDALNQRTPQPMSTDPKTMRKAVFIATLTRPLPDKEGRKALHWARVASTDEAADHILNDHGYCYPSLADNTVLEPLYPDRLGEDLIGLTIPGHALTEELKPLSWAEDAVRDLLIGPEPETPARWARETLTVLIETARRWPHVATGQLNPLLTAHPELALRAGGAALTVLAGLDSVGIDVLDAIEAKLPKSPHTDLDVAAAAIVRRTAAHHLATAEDPSDRARTLDLLAKRLAWAKLSEEAAAASREAVALLRELVQGDPVTHEPALADALGQLGYCLSDLGHGYEALDVTREAAAIRRRLADANPQAYESDYASSLLNLATHLMEVGRSREALEAAELVAPIYRRLAAVDRAHEAELVVALANLGGLRNQLGRRAEALAATDEAVALGRRLAAADPQLYGPRLAQSLGNLGVHLSAVGRWQEAQQAGTEAVELRRRQAAANPLAYNSDLARELSNLAGYHQNLGDRDEARRLAEAAVEIYRRLVEFNPRVYETGLAQALNNLGAATNDPAMGEESVAIRRRLAAANPQAHQPDLAEGLLTLGTLLARSGRRTEALDLTEEATALYRELAAGNPLAHQSGLARVLSNLVKERLEDGRPAAEVLAAGEEAVVLWRALAADDARAYEAGLAQALVNLGTARSRAGCSDEALAVTEEAVSILRRAAVADPQAHEPNLAMALINLSSYLLDAGRQVEALVAGEESVARYRRLAEACRFHEPDLARALGNLATAGGGLPAAEESVAVYRRLVAGNPAAHESEFAMMLGNLVHLLVPAGRLEEALAVSEEAVALSRRLVAAGLSAHQPALASAMLNHGFALAQAARLPEALAASEEAVALGRVAVERHGPLHERVLAMALDNFGTDLFRAGRREEARAALEEAVVILRSVGSREPGREPVLISALAKLGFLYGSMERWPELVEVTTELVARHRRPAAADPVAHEPALAGYLGDLGVSLWRAGRSDEALEAGAQSAEVYRRLAAGDPGAFLEKLRTVEAAQANGLESVGRTAEAAEIRERLRDDPDSPANG
ncbi:tetratricopeptide repeat protein [Kitasatospora acidiphila]|uniref:tetratricopeptide repeat protein n=1 Tax=Kitasatospora acidiphila TaxID=2567942 RepID=UPI003C7790B2